MKHILTRLFEQQSLSREEAAIVLTNIGNGMYNESQIAAFISVFLMRNITIEELIGFREAMLQLALPSDLSEYKPIDIVGTGGDGKNTFNISTLSCFVVAGAGYKVAKHGNYGSTSISGASNVLEHFGAKFTTDMGLLRKSIEQSGVAYLHAPLFNPAMKNVAPIRKALGVRTFFNILGPLISPARPTYQLLGVYNLKMIRLYNYINQTLGGTYALVHSLDGYDEVSLTADTKVVSKLGEELYTPQQFGFDTLSQLDLHAGNSIEEAAVIFDSVLQNTATKAQKDVVIANSALAIRIMCPQKILAECKQEALVSLQSGKAALAFSQFLTIYKN
ncbi:MAG: anthranilate phosphoribosyltransferase [Paludibacteraceae bacterium]|nr:anthranilate phosphoribosyltransferase [Paludibacteraceae bacterium]MBP6283954.1 anthranilate phosphoribosyltransferase [Paludibacteraceae bacterium]